MYLNLKANQSLFQSPPLAFDINAPGITPVKGAKVIVSKIKESRLGKPLQAADPAVWLSMNQASF